MNGKQAKALRLMASPSGKLDKKLYKLFKKAYKNRNKGV